MREAREMRRAQVPAVPRNYINKTFAQIINNRPNKKDIPPPKTMENEHNINMQKITPTFTDKQNNQNDT